LSPELREAILKDPREQLSYQLQPLFGIILTGPTNVPSTDLYTTVAGPLNFGSGGGTDADSGSGDLVGISGSGGILLVPHGYVSGTALSDNATYDNATFASLGLTPGTYVWEVGDWSEPEIHAPDRSGARWRLNSFSARLRFTRLGCAAAQIALLRFS
jgi:hypothetical protein